MTCDKSPETVGGVRGEGGGGATPDAERKCYGFIDVAIAGSPRTYPLSKRVVFVGRERKCEIRLSNEKISREQCVLLAEEDDNGNCQMYLMNLTSRLTTFHESRVLDNKEKVRLNHGDRIKLCGTELRYRLYATETPVKPMLSSREKLRRIVTAAASQDQEIQEAKPKPQLDKTMIEVLKVLKAKALMKSEAKLCRSSSAPDLLSITAQQPLASGGSAVAPPTPPRLPVPVLAMRKRGGSMPETDMRKAVLQRCFRRAFRERLNQVAKGSAAPTAATTELLASPPRANSSTG